MRALLCCPSKEDRTDLVRLLGSLDVRAVATTHCDEALELACRGRFELVLVNLDAEPGWRSTLEAFRAFAPEAPVLAYSRLPEERTWLDAMDAGAFDFVCKPFCGQGVSWVFENALKAHQVAA